MQDLSDLPVFDAPPVSEVALGLEFAPSEKWRVTHFGLFWDRVRKRFPRTEMPSPIAMAGGGSFRFVSDPAFMRLWFLDSTGNNLLQLQAERFFRNWRQVDGTEIYPRYTDFIRPQFMQDWKEFCDFLVDEGLGQPKVARCEILYTNDIEPGEEWKGFDELSKVTPLWRTTTGGKLDQLEVGGLTASIKLPDGKGTLTVELQRVIRMRDANEILQFRFVANGSPNSSSLDDVMDWMDVGRASIVRTFDEVTTPTMHKIWRKQI